MTHQRLNKVGSSASHAVRQTIVLLALISPSGCVTVGPDYEAPRAKVPAAWTDTGPVAQPVEKDITQWWKAFNDPTLTSLINQAIANNLDLVAARQRIVQARAARDVAQGGLFPTLSANGSYQRTSIPNNGGGRDLWQAGLDAAWEMDIFGGIRRGAEAADADTQAAIEDRRDVMVSLTAEVAMDYANLRSYQQQLAITNQNTALQQHSLDLTKQLFDAGLNSGLDVANAQALLATTRAQVPVLESQARQTIYAISVLLGEEPTKLVDQLQSSGPIPVTPASVPVGLPSDVLRRRPDIRRAEAQLHAATARIGVATADLYPKFSLTGSLGVQGQHLTSLGDWASHFYGFGPSVNWPILQGGQIEANIRVQNSLQQQALTTYRQTILTAFQEVESSLVAVAKEQMHTKLLDESIKANEKTLQLSSKLYSDGQTDYLEVINAQRSVLQAQLALAQSQASLATDVISLYKALGGGWNDNDDSDSVVAQHASHVTSNSHSD